MENKTIDFRPKKKTGVYLNRFIEVFEAHCNEKRSFNSMMAAITAVDESLFDALNANDNEVNEALANEIVEAFYYIGDYVFTSEKNEERVVEHFGGYPLIFCLGNDFEFELYKVEIDNCIARFSEVETELFDKIFDAIWDVDADRVLSLNDNHLALPRVIEEEEQEMYLYAVKDLICDFILENTDDPEGCVLFFARECMDAKIVSVLINADGYVFLADAKELNRIGKEKNLQHNVIYEDFNIEL